MSISKKQLRRVQIIRFILPITLFAIVASYETWEHILLKGEFYFDIHLTAEIAFFGILGPTAVFMSLTYIVRLLESQMTVSEELEVLNIDLEQKVVERTEELAEQNLALEKANQELQQLDQLKSDFVSLVSHELRGPLTALNGGIELALQEGDSMPPESKRVLEIMSWESKRLTDFVQTILDVSRLDAGKLPLILGPVAVNPLIRRTINLVFAGKDREIIFDDKTHLPPGWADEIYLEKIISNLLSNAEKYAPIDTPVKVTTEQSNGSLSISIIDHGPGVPSESQSLVFERFFRLEKGERITTKGWGLGLYFAKALAEAQACSLSLKSPFYDSKEHPGTAFILKIPITEEVPSDD